MKESIKENERKEERREKEKSSLREIKEVNNVKLGGRRSGLCRPKGFYGIFQGGLQGSEGYAEREKKSKFKENGMRHPSVK